MSIANLYSFCRRYSESMPLSSRLDDQTIVCVLSFLEIREQIKYKRLCRSNRDQITLTIQCLAIKNLIQGKQSNRLDELAIFFKIYKKLSGKILDPKYVMDLDLSCTSVCKAALLSITHSFVSSFIESEFTGHSMTDDQLVEVIKHFPSIRRLKIFCRSVDVFTQISDSIQQLQDLNATIYSPTDKVCTFIAKFKKLRHLELNGCWLSNIPFHIKELAALKKLERLTFSGCFWIPEKELYALAHLKLKYFDIKCCEITSFSVIPNFSQLESLRFNRMGITDEQMSVLCNHEHLQNLSIRSSDKKVSEKIVKNLLKIKTLKVLEIDSDNIDISIPCHQRMMNVWRAGASFVRSNPVAIGLLTSGFAISWPFTGAFCAFMYYKTKKFLFFHVNR